MKKFFPLLALACLSHVPLFACCSYDYEGMLIDTGPQLLAAPETLLDAEIRKLAPKAEFVRPTVVSKDKYGNTIITGMPEAGAFAGFLDAALTRDGRPAEARKALVAAYRIRRSAASSSEKIPPIPSGLPDAFLLFEKAGDAWRDSDGAQADNRYKACLPARELWRAVLAKPEAGRRELTVPALYMLARAELENPDRGGVRAVIEAVRAAVRAGAPDPVGYAAATCQLERHLAGDDWEKLENLLVQSGANMDGAFVLYHVQRHCRNILSEAEPHGHDAVVREARAHPAVRRLITAYVLSRGGPSYDGRKDAVNKESESWLKVLGSLDGELPEAAQIAAVAYEHGDYTMAARWVDRAPKSDTLAALIGSRLMLREDHTDLAADRLAAAVPRERVLFFSLEGTSGWSYEGAAGTLMERLHREPGELFSGTDQDRLAPDAFTAEVAAELAVLRMEQGRHPEALDLFLRAGFSRDAAVVAERFVPTPELIAFVNAMKPVGMSGNSHGETNPPYAEYMKTLLARRLMREGKPDAAGAYFNAEDRKVFDIYRALCRRGYDATLPAKTRADAFFRAYQLVSDEGTTLFLSVSGPRQRDRRISDPDAPVPGPSYWENENSPVNLRTRIGAGTVLPLPEVRDRIMRFRAGELALYASSLLPENDADSAYMLWSAGRRHAVEGDARSADVFYKLLCLRHPQTELGRAAILAHRLPAFEGDDRTLKTHAPAPGK